MDELIIEAGRAERQYWRDLWRYRELLYFLTWRNLLVRYKQTVVGVSWALVRPIITIAVLTLVFGRLAKMPSGGVPYPILVLCGTLPWHFFAAVLSEGGNSLVSSSALVSKIYFPRLAIPISSAITSLVDFLISAALLGGLMFWYRYLPPWHLMFLPVFIALLFAAAFGMGLWVAALMVEYRDFRHIVPVVVQLGLYASPVAYMSNIIPAEWRFWYYLNPMAAVIDGFRWSILGGQHHLNEPGLALSCGVIALLLSTSIWYFRKTERRFADVI